MVRTEDILGYPVTTAPAEACIAEIVQWIGAGEKGRYLVCANPHSLETARSDRLFDAALRQADLVVPDGVGIVIASRILGGTIRQRVTGSDIFQGVSAALNEAQGLKVFFLGSTKENLAAISERMHTDFPNVTVAGVYSPPFADEFSSADNEHMVAAVNRARPDVLWVGMTAPKQEKWIYQHRERLEVNFTAAIGAVFDFYTGQVKRSHPIFLKLGLEWFPRLLQEPRRLWRRNFVSNPCFLARVWLTRLALLKKERI